MTDKTVQIKVKGIQGAPGKDADEAVVAKRVEDAILPKIKSEIPTIDSVVEKLLPLVPKPKDGEKGERGDDGVSPEAGDVAEELKLDEDFVASLKGKDGADGKDGQDGSPDTGEEIVEKLTSLKDQSRLSFFALKDTPTFKGGAGYLYELSDVEVLAEPTNNQALSWDTTKKKWVPKTVSGGGGGTWGSITGTLSDQTDLQAALDAKLDVGSTTADVPDSFDARYVTDADLVVIANTSGINTGDVTVSDSSEIDLTLTGQQISASIVAGSIDETKLDVSVNASLDLADSASQPGHTHVATDITDFDTAVSNNTDVAANTAARHSPVTVTDSSEIDFTLTGQNITASIIAGSIDETKLDASTNASLDLADTAVQPAALASYVPYTGATTNVNLGAHDLYATNIGVGTTTPELSIHTTGDVLVEGMIKLGAGAIAPFLQASSVNDILLGSTGGGTLDLLQFGGVTSDYPAIQYQSAQSGVAPYITTYYADDSGYINFKTGGLALVPARVSTDQTPINVTFSYFADATSGDVDITLPAPDENEGQLYLIKKIDSSANVVNIIDVLDTPTPFDTLTHQNDYALVQAFSNGTDVVWQTVFSSKLASGMATFLNSGASSDLKIAVTDETGSGSLVFASSPTLVTPDLGTPSAAVLTNATGLPVSTGISGLGSGVATFLATPSSANLASAVTGETGSGALVFATSPTLVTPALGTPSSVVLTNGTGLPVSTGISGLGTGVATALAVNVGTAGAFVVNGGALGTPSSGTLTNATGLPISTGVSGLGSGIATFLATPSSANLATAITDETGSGALVFGTSPTLVTPNLGTPSAVTLTNATGLPLTTGVTGTLGVTNGGTGTATAFTAGSVVFASTSGVYSQDNSNIFWDNTNKRLGIGTGAPATTLHVDAGSGNVPLRIESTGTTAQQQFSGTGTIVFSMATTQGAARTMWYSNNGSSALFKNTTDNAGTFAVRNSSNSDVFNVDFGAADDSVVINASSDVGIGVGASPTTRLHVKDDDNTTVVTVEINATSANVTSADTFIDFRSSSGSIGSIAGTASSGVIAYNTFTGSHWSQSDTIHAVRREERVVEKKTIQKEDDHGVPYEEEVTEERDKVWYESDLQAGAVLISIDEMSEWEGEEESDYLPKVEVSSQKEDKRVYGVYGGHDKDGDIIVLALGAGRILVCDEGGEIEVGDFLCSSSKPGYAMRYDGNDMRVVIAKARKSFTKGKGEIPCTYLCG